MAGDSDQERTEEATPRKRDDARNEGRIARSPELNAAAGLLGAALALNALGPGLAARLGEIMRSGLALAGAGPLDRESLTVLLQGLGWKVMAASSALLLALVFAAGAMAAIQARGVLTLTPLEPKLERINPLPNLKRFFGVQPWVDLLKSLLKLVIVAATIWHSLGSAWTDSLGLSQSTPMALGDVVRSYGVRLLMSAGLCYLAFAAADYLYQHWQHEKELRMSKQEVKEEAKQSEGDPMMKARMRAFGRSLARRQMFREVPNADVVVTNPTHIAVALRYDPDLADAPVVIAMGERKIAQRIKEIAREAGVPTVENRPLARALLASAHVGMAIPPELYLAVAEVLAWVIGKRGRLRGGITA
jgi:flagellar biosynthetic protein FlhB